MHPERRRHQVPHRCIRTRRQSFLLPQPVPTETESCESIRERLKRGMLVLLSSLVTSDQIPLRVLETCLFIR
jgi:hypothetical protein